MKNINVYSYISVLNVCLFSAVFGQTVDEIKVDNTIFGNSHKRADVVSVQPKTNKDEIYKRLSTFDSEIKKGFQEAQKNNILFRSNSKPENSFLINVYGFWKNQKVNLSIVVTNVENLQFAQSGQLVIKIKCIVNADKLEGVVFLYDEDMNSLLSLDVETIMNPSKPVLFGAIGGATDEYLLIWAQR